MSNKPHEHAHIIDALGGATKLAKLLSSMTDSEVSCYVVANWKTRGISYQWRHHVATLARKQNKSELIPEDFHKPISPE